MDSTTIVVALIILLVIKIIQKVTLGRCKSYTCLVGKTALVTGGNSGLGYQTALVLASRGCRVIIADKDNCDESKASIIKKTCNENIVTKQFNLASLSSVRQLAKDINATEDRLDILINNAGTSGLGNHYTEDGLQIGMQVNHFGSFLLTHLLIDLLKKSAPSRIIFVSSIAAYIGIFSLNANSLNFFKNWSSGPLSELLVYSNSKLCNLITSNEFAKRLEGTGVTSNSLHPGLVYTPIYNKFYNTKGNWIARILTILTYITLMFSVLLFSKNVKEGAQTALHLALDESIQSTTGRFFSDCAPFKMPPIARSHKFRRTIWSASEEFVKLLPNEKL